MAQIYFKSFKVSKWRLFKNASEFQDISVREFQFGETIEERRYDAYDCILHNLYVTMELYQSKQGVTREMTAKELKFFKNTTWYHGTTLSGWRSICELGIKADFNVGISLDFGNGFYLSNNIENTERYVSNVIKYSNSSMLDDNIPVIIVFEFCPYEWLEQGIKYCYFPKYNMQFAEFVFENRLNYMNQNMHGYDVTAGVTTDTKPTYLMQQFFLGNIEKSTVLEEFCKRTSVKQICIHKQKLCDIIYPKKAYILDGKELNVHDYKQR